MQLRHRALIGALATAAVALAAVVVGAPAQANPTTTSYSTTIAGNPTDIYYPTGLTAGQKLPFALLLQGAAVDKGYYSSYASQVASYGFIVIVPNNNNPLLGGLYANETEVTNTALWSVFENASLTSPLKGHIDVNSMALLGHSYGGVTGLFATSGLCVPPFCLGAYVRPLSLKAAAFYGTNSTVGPITLPNLLNGVPVELIQGSLDGKALPADTQTSYDLMIGAKHALVSLDGANHYGIADVDNPAGAAADANVPTLGQATATSEVALWSAMWLKAQLGDTAAQTFIYSTGDPADANVTVQTAG